MFKFFEKTNVRITFFFIGAIFLINAIIATVSSDMGLGVIITYVTAIVLLVSSSGEGFLSTKPMHIFKIVVLGLLCLLLAGGALLYITGGSDNATFEEDAVIVLGTTVKGDQPTKALQNRLDATIEYNKKNPDATIIVTGGQGTDENDTEASVMAAYLEKSGISPSVIIKEDRATSTVENFSYAKEFLSENATVCYISNDFHIYRAGELAKQAGIENATHYHGNTPWFMVIPNAFRESVVILKMWFLD